MMPYKKVLPFILAAILLALFPGVAQAVKEIEIVGSYFANEYFTDAWNRLELRINNNSAKDFQGSVTFNLGGRYVRDVFVEAGKAGSQFFYLPPLSYVTSDLQLSERIVLRDQRGRIVDETRLTISVGPAPVFVGVMGKQAGDFKRISNTADYLTVVGIGPESLDYLQFTHNFRLLIFSNPGALSLSPQQEANLLSWLEAGGLLLVGGGSGWQQSAALLPPGLLPLRPTGVEMLGADDLAPLGLPYLMPGDYTIGVGDISGRALISSQGKALLVAKEVGRGTVLWSALDLESPPLTNAANAEAFWQKVLLLRPVDKNLAPDANFVNNIFNAISQDDLATSLTPSKLFLILLGYIILVGPVNWLVLWKIDRREWAWFVIPAVALLLTGGFFAFGRLGRSSEEVIFQVNLISQHTARLATAESFSGVFVSSSKRITLSSETMLVPRSGEMESRLEGGKYILELASPPLWSVQQFYASKVLATPGGIELKGDPKSGFQITNNGEQDFYAAFLKLGQDWFTVDDLAAGHSKLVTKANYPDLQSILARYHSSRFFSFPQWYDISYLAPDSPVFFLGFSEVGTLPIDDRKRVAVDIWIQPLALQDLITPGELNIPRGLLTPQVLAPQMDKHPMRDYFYYSGEEAVVDLVFTLPEKIDYSQGEFLLSLDSLWGDSRGKVLLFNFKDNTWQEVGGLDKQGLRIPLTQPGNYVRENRLTVRISYTGELGFNLDGLDISIKGGRIDD